jgi:predicted acylesterase/phospholipase RssA
MLIERLACAADAKEAQSSRRIEKCYILEPPVSKLAPLDFSKFDEMFMAGYEYGVEYFDKLKREGSLNHLWGKGDAGLKNIGQTHSQT